MKNTYTHIFKLLTLAILISVSANSFAANEEDEISDLKKADACFRIVDEGMKLTSDVAVEQKILKQKRDSLSLWKSKIDKEIKAVGNESGTRLNRLNSDIKKYSKADAEFKEIQLALSKKIAQFNENKARNVKNLCSKTKFSEDAIEQICTIGKKYPYSCSKALEKEK